MQRKVLAGLVLVSVLVLVGRVVVYRLPLSQEFGGNQRLLYTLSVDHGVYQVGEGIFIEIRILNPTSSQIWVRFETDYWCDYEIQRNGEGIYRYSWGLTYTEASWYLVVPARASVVANFTHSVQEAMLLPGRYQIRGWIVGQGEASLPVFIGQDPQWFVLFLDPGFIMFAPLISVVTGILVLYWLDKLRQRLLSSSDEAVQKTFGQS